MVAVYHEYRKHSMSKERCTVTRCCVGGGLRASLVLSPSPCPRIVAWQERRNRILPPAVIHAMHWTYLVSVQVER